MPVLAVTPYYFVGHRIAMALFDGTVAVWALTEVRQGMRRRAEATSRDHASRVVIVLSALVGFLLAALARSTVTAAGFPNGAGTFALGLAFVWAGIGLRWWSFWPLGR